MIMQRLCQLRPIRARPAIMSSRPEETDKGSRAAEAFDADYALDTGRHLQAEISQEDWLFFATHLYSSISHWLGCFRSFYLRIHRFPSLLFQGKIVVRNH